jgi:hypothetical protein
MPDIAFSLTTPAELLAGLFLDEGQINGMLAIGWRLLDGYLGLVFQFHFTND